MRLKLTDHLIQWRLSVVVERDVPPADLVSEALILSMSRCVGKSGQCDLPLHLLFSFGLFCLRVGEGELGLSYTIYDEKGL